MNTRVPKLLLSILWLVPSVLLAEDGTLSDLEGNSYSIARFGSLFWMTENLQVTRFKNGDTIPLIAAQDDWATTRNPARSAYNNDSSDAELFGYLYNFPAIEDRRGLCPEGWRIPNRSDWIALAELHRLTPQFPDAPTNPGLYMGGAVLFGSPDMWQNPPAPGSADRTVAGRFQVLPTGSRGAISFRERQELLGSLAGEPNDGFSGRGSQSFFWSSSRDAASGDAIAAWIFSNGAFSVARSDPNSGFSVRCVKSM